MSSRIEGKTYVVTGGAGFIGSHLVEALIKRNAGSVVSLDNYFTGTKDNHFNGATYIEGHTRDIEVVVHVKPDVVYHLGEYPRVEKSFDDMGLVWDFNVVGTFAVLEFCRKHNAKLVYAGSSTKYGDDGLGRNQSPYAFTKAMNTDLVKNYGDWFGLSYAITYFYNVYGPRERTIDHYGTVIAEFVKLYQEKKPLTVVSPGTQKRNFTHVNDIVEGLLLVGEEGEGDEFGLGADESYSILEVAELFGDKIEMLPERKGNRMDATLDTSRVVSLGWRAENRLEDYITAIKAGT